MGATQEQAAGMATYGIKYAQGVAEAVAKNLQEQYVNEVKSWGDAAKEELGGGVSRNARQGRDRKRLYRTKDSRLYADVKPDGGR